MFRPSFATPLSLILAFSWLVGSFSATASEVPFPKGFSRLMPARALPGVMATPLKGDKIPLRDFVQREGATHGFVLLHLWAPNCPPCHAEMKELDAAHTKLAEKGVKVIAIAEDPDGLVSVPAFSVRHSLTNRDLLIDTTRALMLALRPAGIPMTYLVLPDGKIVGAHTGPVKWTELVD